MNGKKKTILMILLAAGLFFSPWTQVTAASGAEKVTESGAAIKEGPYGITLSWSENPSVTQSVTWSAALPGTGRVQYIEAAKSVSSTDFKKATEVKAACTEMTVNTLYRFECVMRKLKPDTLYRYRIGIGTGSKTAWSEPLSFRTAPSAADSFQFMYLGDVQFEIREEDYQSWSELVSEAYKDHPGVRFSLAGGDYVNSCANTKDWNCFLEAAKPVFAKIPLMTVPGNHETSILPSYYLKIFSIPKNGPQTMPEENYSFDYGNCHFVELNTCIFMPERKNYLGNSSWSKLITDTNTWIRNDLASSNAKWKIITMHHPAYGIDEDEDDDIYQLIRDNWTPIFEEAKVDLVLCGHQHATMRTDKINGVTYVMGNSGQKRSRYFEVSKIPAYVKFIDTEKQYLSADRCERKQT